MSKEFIAFIITIGIVGIVSIITYLICTKVLDERIKRVKKNHQTLYEKIVEYNALCDKSCDFYNENIEPLKREIDKLCADNYTLEEIKNKCLREKRLKLLNLQNEYDEIVEERKSLYNEIQSEVDKCDKDINILWTQSEDNK